MGETGPGELGCHNGIEVSSPKKALGCSGLSGRVPKERVQELGPLAHLNVDSAEPGRFQPKKLGCRKAIFLSRFQPM